jgi:hypothetical protein
MANFYIPEFPYTGSQAIVASDRIMLLSKQDSTLIFGEKAVSLSSKGSVNIDSVKNVLINPGQAGIIELGLNATEAVIKGDSFVANLRLLVQDIELLSSALSKLSESNLAGAVPLIVQSATKLNETANILKDKFKDNLSTVTKTK